MAKILLDYVFPISVIVPTTAASTAFLKQACLVVKPKVGVDAGQVVECVNATAVAALTDNLNASQLFNAGMAKVFIMTADDLDLADILAEHENEFYTLIVSDDFNDAEIGNSVSVAAVKASAKIQDNTYTAKLAGVDGNDISVAYVDDGTAGAETVTHVDTAFTVHMEDGVSTAQQIADAVEADSGVGGLATLVDVAIDDGDEDDIQTVESASLEGGVDEVLAEGGIDVGEYKGVVAVQTQDAAFAAEHSVIENRVAFFSNATNKAKNMCYAFGSLLSNAANWRNQQYIAMPFDDGVDELGEATSLFDDKVSFVIHDDEFGNRLALFAVGGRAIIAPYVLKNMRIDLQSRALQWISANQPDYTIKEASLLETRLQEDVINDYINDGLVTSGTVTISLEESNFVASGAISVPEPKAMWRVVSEMVQTS